MTYSEVLIHPIKGNKFTLATDIRYKTVTVPKGFSTNGANIPRLLWSLIPPNKSDVLPAVIVHDYLCSLDLYELADEYFEEILILLGVGVITRLYLVTGVKTWHLVAYKEDGQPKNWLKLYLKITRGTN